MSDLTALTSKLLDDVEGFQRRFVYFPDDSYLTATTLWILHTWAFEAAHCTPYIYANSAEKRSGKTLLMDALSALAKNPLAASGTTGAGLFRNLVIETEDGGTIRHTAFIDEVDTVWSGGNQAEDIRQVLNLGFRKRGSTILRAADSYSAWSPKMMAGIDNGAMPDTVRDRSIMLTLKRASSEEIEGLDRWHERIVEPLVEELSERLMEWAELATSVLADMFPQRIEVNARAFDISEPLLAIAELAGDPWTERGRRHLTVLLADETEALSTGAKLLTIARDFFTQHPDAKAIPTSEFESRSGMPPKVIGNTLRPYGISPTTVRHGGIVSKGYPRHIFTDAFARYLSSED